MSHSVTIQTRTVTTGSPSSINTGFCKSWTGLLKIAQVVLGIVYVSIMFYTINHKYAGHTVFENLFFLLVATTFMVTSLILVFSSLCSFTTESIVSKTIFELLYHAVGFALLLAASIVLLTKATKSHYRTEAEKMEFTSAIIGAIIVVLEVDGINKYLANRDIFLMLMATAFMIGTAIFIISYIFSPVSEAIIGKTYYDIIFNSFALFLILVASIFVVTQDSYRQFRGPIAAGYLGIVLSILYAANLVLAVRNKV